MKRSHEQRIHARHPVRGELTGHTLPGEMETGHPIQATIHDVSQGGLGILAAEPVTVSSPIRCDILIAGALCSIPTLTQVRWVENSASGPGVRMGLQFLL